MFKSKLYLFCICLWLACANSFAVAKPIKPHPWQWDLKKSLNLKEIDSSWPNITYYGDNFTGAWEFINHLNSPSMNRKPGEDVVVAVVDGGYTPVPNFMEALVRDNNGQIGYQFIYDCRVAGSCLASTPEGSAKIDPKPGALDLGDYVSQEDIDTSRGFFDTRMDKSTWHGTSMIGAIVSQGYSGSYATMAGGAYGAKVLPIRTMGKISDSVNLDPFFDALEWAAGINEAIPNNNPVDVINISLTTNLACNSERQRRIDKIVNSRNHPIIVVGAGNRAVNVSTMFPANCKNVISVSAKSPDNKLWYNFENSASAFGGSITITASAGGVLSASECPGNIICRTLGFKWSSSQKFNPKDKEVVFVGGGTSFAAARVSAAVANVISVLKLKGETWDYNKIVDILQKSADKFAPGGNCHKKGCVPDRTLDVGKAIELAGGISNCQGLDINGNFHPFVGCPK